MSILWIIQNLEARQLIKRRISEKNQRRPIISLSDTDVNLVELIAPKSEARPAHITETFGYGRLELLGELVDVLDEKTQ